MNSSNTLNTQNRKHPSLIESEFGLSAIWAAMESLFKKHFSAHESDAWTVWAAKTAEKAMELLKVDFDYVTEFEGLRLFRKRN